jgi:hypothetical protein
VQNPSHDAPTRSAPTASSSPAGAGPTIPKMYAGDVGGDVGETIGIALVAIGAFVGWRFGPKAERNFFRRMWLVLGGSLVLLVLLGLIWWAIAGAS